jgi:hypothetical protein
MSNAKHSYVSLKKSDVRFVLSKNSVGTPEIDLTKVSKCASPRSTLAVGTESAFDLQLVRSDLRLIAADMVSQMKVGIAKGTPPDKAFSTAEQQHSVRWYESLITLPVSVQEEYGFWLYLTVGVLNEVLEVGGFVKVSADGASLEVTKRHIGADKKPDVLAHRMFVLGRLSKHFSNATGPSLAASCGSNYQELFSSHILGGSIRTQPGMQAALVEAIASNTQPEQRARVRGVVNPVRFVVAAELLSADDARDELRQLRT